MKKGKKLFYALFTIALFVFTTTVVNAANMSFVEKFQHNFIADERWKYLTNGLIVTLKISFFAVIIGIIGGFMIAIL